MERLFKYNELDGEVVLTYTQVMEEYWVYWSTQMLRAGKSPLMTGENCLDDFLVVHWGWEIRK